MVSTSTRSASTRSRSKSKAAPATAQPSAQELESLLSVRLQRARIIRGSSSRFLEIKLSDRLAVIATDLATQPRPHTAYFGFQDAEEAQAFGEWLGVKHEIRKAKRLTTYTWEVKAWGVEMPIILMARKKELIKLAESNAQHGQHFIKSRNEFMGIA